MSRRPQAGDRISEYLLLEKIGEGGFGEVWKARHHIFEQDLVAVKFPVRTDHLDSLRREGTLQHDLQHPHIVRTLGLDPQHDPPYFVMEYVSGPTLRAVLDRRGRIPYAEFLEIAEQVIDAVAFAHAHGVLHRDLKPENILLTPTPDAGAGAALPRYRVQVSDFGLGHVLRPAGGELLLSAPGLTSDGRLLAGTLEYLAPELRRGKGEPTPAADVYALGATLYELLVGDPPAGAFRLPSHLVPPVPAALDGILWKCLACHPEERYRDAGEIQAAVRDLRAGRFEALPLAPTPPGEAAPAGSAPPGTAPPPFLFRTGAEATTLRALVNLCEASWEDAKHHLFSGSLEPWLRQVREHDLARRAAELREGEVNRDKALERFLEATGLVRPPRLEVDVRALDLGVIERGQRRAVRCFVNNYGRGYLFGEARVEPPADWITPTRRTFEGNDVALELAVATDRFEAGTEVRAALVLESNGGKVEVPLRFDVGFRPAALAIEPPALEALRLARYPVRKTLHLRNDGDQPLRVTCTASAPWIELPGGREVEVKDEADVEVRLIPPAGPAARPHGNVRFHEGEIVFDSSLGRKPVPVRLYTPLRFNPSSAIAGLLVGLVPFLAELILVILVFDALLSLTFFSQERTSSRLTARFSEFFDNLSFLAGLLPGVLWHWRWMRI